MQRKVLVIFSLLLFSILSSNVNSEPVTNEGLVIDQPDGYHFSNGIVNVSGISNIPLNNATWTLFNNSDDNQNLVPIDSGNYLSEVVPVQQDVWSWSLTINASGISCTCILTVGVNNSYSSIYIYIGESSHKPIILGADSPTYIVNDEDIEIEIDLILPPTQNTIVFIESSICNASPDKQRCISEPIEVTTQSTLVNNPLILSINQSLYNLDEGNWIVFFSVLDSALNPSNIISKAFTIDTTAPEISLLVRETITEGEMLEVYADAMDFNGSGNLSYTWKIGEPGQQMKGYISESDDKKPYVSFVPEISGNWTIEVVVRDNAGWQNSSSIIFHVSNFEPVPLLNIDSLRIENGDEIKLTKDGGWVLSSSDSYDTRNDQDGLIYYWKFESEDEMKIFTGTEVSSDEGFQSDNYDVQFIIYDDDSASSSIEFSISFEEESPLDSISPIAKGIVVLILLAVTISIVVLSRKQIVNDDNSKIPKWKPKK